MAELGDWALRGACRDPGVPQEIFFPERENDVNISRAKAICSKCPVKRPCLEEALARRSSDDEYIWGGTTKQERIRIRAFHWMQQSLGEASSG